MPKFVAARLLSPISLGDLNLPNRVVMAPLTRGRAGKDRIPNEMMAEYYSQRSAAGLIISEATTVSSRANGWVGSPGIYNDAMVEGWKRVTDTVHDSGGRMILQLWHCGRASHSDFHGGQPPVAASAVKIDGDHIRTPEGKKDYETPEPLTLQGIADTIKDYRNAAANAKLAGFDGVEVHSANGYLLDTFLQSKTNHRSDQYGGSITNRCRMLREVVAAVIEVWSSERVGVRLSPNGSFNDMGSPDYQEQFTAAASMLSEFDLGYLHVMDGLGFGFHELGPAMTLADFRNVYDGYLMGNCGYDYQSAQQRISSGDADLISFGRPFIANPDLVERFISGTDLRPDPGMEYWYSDGPIGYTDFSHVDFQEQ